MSGRSFTLATILFGVLGTSGSAAQAQGPTAPSAPVRTIADAIDRRDSDREVTIAGRASVSSGKLQSSAFDLAIERSEEHTSELQSPC